LSSAYPPGGVVFDHLMRFDNLNPTHTRRSTLWIVRDGSGDVDEFEY
jgi:hypothetical protein